MNLADKKILVVGLGKTGLALTCFLKPRARELVVVDQASREALAPNIDRVEEMGIKVITGNVYASGFQDAEMIVLSPGIPHQQDVIEQARRRGAEVIGEIELAARFIKEPLVAVTGTNGKTTTTTLIGRMLEKAGFKTFVGGNIGKPLIAYVDQKEKADVVVIEISSFQLDTIQTFCPKVGLLLNIAEDHLDRYDGFDGYLESKMRLFERQSASDFAVINGDDPFIKDWRVPSTRFVFRTEASGHLGAVLQENQIIIQANKIHPAFHQQVTLDLSGSHLKGPHNCENTAAAALAAMLMGADAQSIQSVIDEYVNLPHRITYVRTVKGVRFYDDSKATNIHAVVSALRTFSDPVVLLMGGKDKGGDYRALLPWVKKHVKTIVLLGEASPLIKDALGEELETIEADSMAEAVLLGFQKASGGEVVLLSPACSSFDMFRSYKERGVCFQDHVNKLTENDQAGQTK